MRQFALELDNKRVEIKDSNLLAPVLTYIVTDKKWRLEQPYTYQDGEYSIKVPVQFMFDLASIPRAFWWLIAPFELSMSAPLIHDFLYRFSGKPPAASIVPQRTYTRLESDLLFGRIMKEEGVWAWRRTAAYHAVRWFGGNAWGR